MRDELGFQSGGKASASRVMAPGHETIYEHGQHPNTIKSHFSKIPDWVTCDAKCFERVWLPRFENGEMPPCTDEEWQKIQNAFHSEESEVG